MGLIVRSGSLSAVALVHCSSTGLQLPTQSIGPVGVIKTGLN